jgi:hypothetical protein
VVDDSGGDRSSQQTALTGTEAASVPAFPGFGEAVDTRAFVFDPSTQVAREVCEVVLGQMATGEAEVVGHDRMERAAFIVDLGEQVVVDLGIGSHVPKATVIVGHPDGAGAPRVIAQQVLQFVVQDDADLGCGPSLDDGRVEVDVPTLIDSERAESGRCDDVQSQES